MLKSKKNTGENYSGTVIGQGIRIEAKLLSGNGTVRIDGEYHGEVYIDGVLIVEKSGIVNGNINVKIAYIYGTVAGNVKCSDLLHITSTGKITGDIECEAILMDEGAVFIGRCKMNERREQEVSDAFDSAEPSDPLGLAEIQ